MRNPFIAAAMKAAINAQMAMKSAIQAFNLGYVKALSGREFSEANASRAHRTSHRTVAQDKRDALKARNRKRARR